MNINRRLHKTSIMLEQMMYVRLEYKSPDNICSKYITQSFTTLPSDDERAIVVLRIEKEGLASPQGREELIRFINTETQNIHIEYKTYGRYYPNHKERKLLSKFRRLKQRIQKLDEKLTYQ